MVLNTSYGFFVIALCNFVRTQVSCIRISGVYPWPFNQRSLFSSVIVGTMTSFLLPCSSSSISLFLSKAMSEHLLEKHVATTKRNKLQKTRCRRWITLFHHKLDATDAFIAQKHIKITVWNVLWPSTRSVMLNMQKTDKTAEIITNRSPKLLSAKCTTQPNRSFYFHSQNKILNMSLSEINKN